MTNDEHIAIGAHAQRLLDDASFNGLYALVEDELAKSILATTPDQGMLRSQLYYTYNGMRAFIFKLNELKNVKDRIEALLAAENDPDNQPHSD